MRSSRLLDLLAHQHEEWLKHLDAVQAAHQAEREAWAEERKLLLNAAVARNAGDFAARQGAAKPRPQPIASLPEEALKERPRVLGF